MKPCYFNTQKAEEIKKKRCKPCSNMVDDDSYLCEDHKQKAYVKAESYKRGHSMTISQMQQEILKMRFKSKAKPATTSYLQTLFDLPLSQERYQKLANWLEDNTHSIDYEKALRELEKTADFLRLTVDNGQ